MLMTSPAMPSGLPLFAQTATALTNSARGEHTKKRSPPRAPIGEPQPGWMRQRVTTASHGTKDRVNPSRPTIIVSSLVSPMNESDFEPIQPLILPDGPFLSNRFISQR